MRYSHEYGVSLRKACRNDALWGGGYYSTGFWIRHRPAFPKGALLGGMCYIGVFGLRYAVRGEGKGRYLRRARVWVTLRRAWVPLRYALLGGKTACFGLGRDMCVATLPLWGNFVTAGVG